MSVTENKAHLDDAWVLDLEFVQKQMIKNENKSIQCTLTFKNNMFLEHVHIVVDPKYKIMNSESKHNWSPLREKTSIKIFTYLQKSGFCWV